MARPSKNYSKREQTQDRKFTCILYKDMPDLDLILNRLPYYWTRFYYVLHDKDYYTEFDLDEYLVSHSNSEPDWKVGDLKKPHYHLIGYSDSPLMLGRAAINFGVPSNYVQRVSKLKESVQYLIHLNHPNKYQYKREEIITNDECLDKLLKKEISAEEKANALVNFIFESQTSTIAEVAQFALQNNCWDELRRGQHIYTSLLYEKNQNKYKEKS